MDPRNWAPQCSMGVVTGYGRNSVSICYLGTQEAVLAAAREFSFDIYCVPNQ